MAVGFVASASSGSQASVGSFNIGTLGTGARAGIVFVCTHNSATAKDTGVTWNGVAMTLLFSATDTDTEPGVVRAYFLDNVTNGTITVSRTNDAVVTVGYAASISATAGRGLEVAQTITRVSSTQNTDANTSTTGTGASGEVSVDDGSLSGTDSMRFSAFYSGAATPPAQGTNSTALQVLDSTALGSRFVRETTAGQGSRSVGAATGTTDDWALVAVAVRETTVQVNAGHASGTGSSFGAPINVQPNAGHASGTGSAFNATIQISKDVSAGHASGTGQAFNATTTIASAINIATGTGTANVAAPGVSPNAGLASGTGTAFDATVEVPLGTNANAGHAAGTGQAFGVAASIASSSGAAAGSGQAGGPAPAIGVNVGQAAGSGTAFNATVSTASFVNANAGHAAGTGTANAPSVSIQTRAGHASGTGVARGSSAAEAPSSGHAAGSGAAFNATIAIGKAANAGIATGLGGALNATIAIAVNPRIATGTGTAYGLDYRRETVTPAAEFAPLERAGRLVTGTLVIRIPVPEVKGDGVVDDDELALELLLR